VVVVQQDEREDEVFFLVKELDLEHVEDY